MSPTEALYLRVEPELKERLREKAATSGRGLNAEVVWLLEGALKEPAAYGGATSSPPASTGDAAGSPSAALESAMKKAPAPVTTAGDLARKSVKPDPRR